MNKTTKKFYPKERTQAVRLGLHYEGEHSSRWLAGYSIAAKIGCTARIRAGQ
jgi:hypothetical protein